MQNLHYTQIFSYYSNDLEQVHIYKKRIIAELTIWKIVWVYILTDLSKVFSIFNIFSKSYDLQR